MPYFHGTLIRYKGFWSRDPASFVLMCMSVLTSWWVMTCIIKRGGDDHARRIIGHWSDLWDSGSDLAGLVYNRLIVPASASLASGVLVVWVTPLFLLPEFGSAGCAAQTGKKQRARNCSPVRRSLFTNEAGGIGRRVWARCKYLYVCWEVLRIPPRWPFPDRSPEQTSRWLNLHYLLTFLILGLSLVWKHWWGFPEY